MCTPLIKDGPHTEAVYLHELTHSVKSQHKLGPGEVYAFTYGSWVRKPSAKPWRYGLAGLAYGLGYALLFGFSTPLLYLSLSRPELLAAPLILAPLTAGHFWRERRRIEKFIRKCEEERLPPWYLLLRSDVTDYDLGRELRPQIRRKAQIGGDLRWRIIQMRLESL